MLFKIENVSLEFGEKKIFDRVNFIFNNGDKIGIIGDNGSGKTSLFKIISNNIKYSGNVLFENDNFGYLEQDEGFKKLKLHRINIDYVKGNKRSKRVIEKLGCRYECTEREGTRTANGRYKDHLLYAILAKEWRPSKVK